MRIRIIISALIILLLAALATAYIPLEYQTSNHMSDYDVYTVSKDHMDQRWAFDNMRQLMISYTNSGRSRSQLDTKMEFYNNIKIRKSVTN